MLPYGPTWAELQRARTPGLQVCRPSHSILTARSLPRTLDFHAGRPGRLQPEACFSDFHFLYFPPPPQLQCKGFLVGSKHCAHDAEDRACFGVREIWLGDLSFDVTLGKSLNLDEPPYLQSGGALYILSPLG